MATRALLLRAGAWGLLVRRFRGVLYSDSRCVGFEASVCVNRSFSGTWGMRRGVGAVSPVSTSSRDGRRAQRGGRSDIGARARTGGRLRQWQRR
eukprot:2399371-Prymnesium_polylepis.1